MDDGTTYHDIDDLEIEGTTFNRIGISGYFQTRHANSNPEKIAKYVTKTLSNHNGLNLGGRIAIASHTASLIGTDLNGWSDSEWRLTVIDPNINENTFEYVNQFPISKSRYETEMNRK